MGRRCKRIRGLGDVRMTKAKVLVHGMTLPLNYPRDTIVHGDVVMELDGLDREIDVELHTVIPGITKGITGENGCYLGVPKSRLPIRIVIERSYVSV